MYRRTALLMVAITLLFSTATAMAGGSRAQILFDQGHNQRFIIEEMGMLHLSGFAEIMRSKGAIVTSTTKILDGDALKNVTALVISGPFASLRTEEVDAVVRFIERGGRLAAMLHIGPPLSGLLARLDVYHSNGVLHERNNVIDIDTTFRLTGLSGSPLFAGLPQFSVYGSWALDPGKAGTALAQSSSEAWVDLNGDKVLSTGDAVGAFAVVVSGELGSGSFIVFGDDAIFQNRYLDDNNRRLADNLAGWLAGR
ncbi:MAG: DUF4350 domain-containing protein [Desulfuromonadaceae bacterium]|nr:DUF4350 domain-containing protein [Desulfuromonadaceae bacterium]